MFYTNNSTDLLSKPSTNTNDRKWKQKLKLQKLWAKETEKQKTTKKVVWNKNKLLKQENTISSKTKNKYKK